MTNRIKLTAALLGLTLVGVLLVVLREGRDRTFFPADPSSGDPGSAAGEGTQRPLRIGFGFSSGVGDFGWSHGQNRGRLALQARYLQQIEVFFWEGVYEADDCERALSGFADRQVDLAFLVGERNQETVRAWAVQHPQSRLVQWYGTPQPPNLAACVIWDHETAYLCGAVAAMTPETGQRLGVLAAHGSPVIRWVANAFALGARSVRKDLEVEFRVLNTWYDPEAEQEAVQSMATQGVGAVYVIAVAPTQAVAAAERVGVFVLSHFGDQSEFAPTRWLTGTERLWGRLYDDVTRRVLDGNWEATTYQGGLKEGYVRLASFGPAVSPEAVGRVRAMAQAMVDEKRTVFAGALHDSEGALRLPEGEARSWGDLVGQDWMVEGIVEVQGPG